MSQIVKPQSCQGIYDTTHLRLSVCIPAGIGYGLNRLADAHRVGYLVLVEGESDLWTLCYRGFRVLGIPGADMAKVLSTEHLQGICIYLALEEREDDIKRDFRAMGADGTEPNLIHAAPTPAERIRALCELVRKLKPRLLGIDPVVRLARIKDEKAYAEMYNELGPLIDAARETGMHRGVQYPPPVITQGYQGRS